MVPATWANIEYRTLHSKRAASGLFRKATKRNPPRVFAPPGYHVSTLLPGEFLSTLGWLWLTGILLALARVAVRNYTGLEAYPHICDLGSGIPYHRNIYRGTCSLFKGKGTLRGLAVYSSFFLGFGVSSFLRVLYICVLLLSAYGKRNSQPSLVEAWPQFHHSCTSYHFYCTRCKIHIWVRVSFMGKSASIPIKVTSDKRRIAWPWIRCSDICAICSPIIPRLL